MQIQSIRLTNFKNYAGTHTFELGLRKKSRGMRNVVLIGGLNGAGKTSLMDALRLCLYGSRSTLPRLSEADYERYVISMMNKDALADGMTHASVECELIDDRNGIPLELRVCRKWILGTRNRVYERLDLSSAGKSLELVPEESWEELLSAMIPLHVSRLFFFDGERIKELASGPESDQIFRDSIHDLLGIGKYDTLSRDLITLKGLMKRRNLKDKDTQRILDSLQVETEKMQKCISELVVEIEGYEGKMQELLAEQNNIDAEIKRRVKDSASSMGNFKSQIAELETREKQIGDTIRDLCELSLPLLMAGPIATKLVDQLRRERHAVEKTSARGFLRDVEWDLVTRMTRNSRVVTELSDTQLKVVERELKILFENYIDELSDVSSENQLHGLSSTDSSQLEYVLTNIRSESETRFRESLQERERLNIEIDGLYKKLKGVSDEVIDQELSKLGEIRQSIGAIQHEMGRAREVKSRLEMDLARKEDERHALEEKLECADEDRLKMDLIDRMVNLLQEYQGLLVSRRIGELERSVTECYQKLANKTDMVKKIEISEDDFQISLIDKNGSRLERSAISAGEQEIFAIAVIWGLADMTGHRLPMIIDTPLAKLDSKHVRSIARRFFPAASHQVILLSQDREIDEKLYRSLKKNIDHSLLISLGKKDKIREGYFFDQEARNINKQGETVKGYV